MVDCTHDEPAAGGPPRPGAARRWRVRQARRGRGRRRGAHARGLSALRSDGLLRRAFDRTDSALARLYTDRRMGPEAELPAPSSDTSSQVLTDARNLDINYVHGDAF